MIARAPAAIAVFVLLWPAWGGAQEFDPGTPTEQQAAPVERQTEEREQAQKLRRAREELETRREEQARRQEAEHFRSMEMRRVQEIRSTLTPRESYLGHETYWTQRERDSLQWRDPADLSSMARRSTLDHQLNQYQNELGRASALRQGVVNPNPLSSPQLR